MNKFILAICFIALSFAAVFAQEMKKENMPEKDQTAMLKTAMQKLDKMIGRWSGEGWIQQGPKREEFTGAENVQRKLDGLALLIEGRFTDKKDSSRVIHETLAVLNYNPKTSDLSISKLILPTAEPAILRSKQTKRITNGEWIFRAVKFFTRSRSKTAFGTKSAKCRATKAKRGFSFLK